MLSATPSVTRTLEHGILRPAPLHAEEALLDVRIRAERVRGAFELDPSLIDDVETMRERESDLQDLLHEEDGGAAAIDLAEDGGEALPEERGEALRGPVHEHGRGAGDEAARDGEHLLLTARERFAFLLVPLSQAREVAEHFLHDRAVLLGGGGGAEEAQAQVLRHAQVGEDTPLLRHVG